MYTFVFAVSKGLLHFIVRNMYAHAPWCIYLYIERGWGMIFRSGVSPHIMRVLGMRLRLPGFGHVPSGEPPLQPSTSV